MNALGKLLEGMMRGLAPPAVQARPRQRGGFDADLVWRTLEGNSERRRLMAVAAWLWKTGVRDMAAVLWILEHGQRARVVKWYAYYGPRGPARLAALEDFQRRSAAHESGRTEAWLKSKGESR